MEKFNFEVSEAENKVRIDKFLAEKFQKIKPELSRNKIQKIIEEGFVSIAGSLINDISYKVKFKEEIDISIKESEPHKLKAKKIDFEIIYEDDDLMVINKPAGLTVHPGAGNQEDTLVNGLLFEKGGDNLSQINGDFRPGIVHRLDKDTSGLMIVAKNDLAHQILSKDLQNRNINRTYLAFIYGVLEPKKGKIDKNITRSRVNRLKMSVSHKSVNNKVGSKIRNAVTNYEVKEVFGDNFASLVECKLETGRTHQIRVHMESQKHSLIGDQIYSACRKNLKDGVDKEIRGFIEGFERQALHSYQIGFIHPIKKEEMFFEIDLSDDLKELLGVLGRL